VLSTDRAVIAAARSALADLAYRAGPLAERLGTGTSLRIDRTNLAAVRLRLDERQHLDALASLFLLELDLDLSTARAALGSALDTLTAAGLLVVDHNIVQSGATLVPHDDDLLVASDRHDRVGSADIVPGVQRPSDLLARLTIRKQMGSALDLGTGCGIQALLLARHCARVIATDISERALVFARFNAALNGADNIEFRHGSYLDPVAGELFDLVVSNPPYVISPERRFVFRDSGRRGDELCKELIDALPPYLNDGGFATVLISWAEKADPTVLAPVRWLAERGWSGLVMSGGLQEPYDAAEQWNQGVRDDPELFATRLKEWIGYFEAQGIERIAYGGVLLCRREGEPWVSTVPMPSGWTGSASDHLLRVVEANDALQAGSAYQRPITLAPDAELVQTLRPSTGGFEVASTELCLRTGFAYALSLDAYGTGLLAALAVEGTLEKALSALADEVGRPATEIAEAAHEFVHQLLTLGFFRLL
jgi:methylase of polypeptide subunit release factors